MADRTTTGVAAATVILLLLVLTTSSIVYGQLEDHREFANDVCESKYGDDARYIENEFNQDSINCELANGTIVEDVHANLTSESISGG